MQHHTAPLFGDEPQPQDTADHRLTGDELLAMWNEAATRHHMRTARSLGDEPRRRRIAKLLRAQPYASYWREVIDRVCVSDFCRGLIPGKDFLAGFDFLTRLHTHQDVLEGKYDNRQTMTREQFRASQRRHMNDSLHGRSVTIITDETA
jgi:hypothetical protein